MVHEIAVALLRPLRRVVPIAPDAPLAPAVPSALRLAEEERRRKEQEQQQIHEERRQIAAVLAGLNTTAASLRQDVDRMRGEMTAAAVDLAVAAASRLIHKAIDADAFGVEELVRELTARLDGDRSVTVFLHPDDLELLQRRSPAASADGRTIQWTADLSLRRGDCRAASGDVSLFSQLKTQLADLHDHLRRSAAHEPEDA